MIRVPLTAMSLAAALVALPLAVQAQTAPAPAAAAPAAVTEADIDQAGEAFGAEIEAMQGEIMEARVAAGADTAKANQDADAIQAKYQAKADVFAETLKTFLDANPGAMPPEAVTVVMEQIKGAPAMVRSGIMAAPLPAPSTN